MKLLGWDTSSKSGAIVALEWPDLPTSSVTWNDVRLVAEWSLNVDSQHSERLLWGIHQALEAARWKLSDVDLFSVGLGPGSFTGVRIGVTTARTLAHATGKPLVGFSSLAALARPAALWLQAMERSQAIVIASTDAAKGELFSLWGEAGAVLGCAAVPEGGVPGLWSGKVFEGVIAPSELMDSIRSIQGEVEARSGAVPWVVIGEGRNRYREEWARLPASARLEIPSAFPHQVQGRYLGMLSWEAWRAGLVRPPLSVYPRYLRASDAEVKLKAGLLKPAPMVAPGSGGGEMES